MTQQRHPFLERAFSHRIARTRLLIIALGSLLLLCGWLYSPAPSPALAQDTLPIQLTVTAGFDGHYRRNQWFPITVIASNDGPDIRGTLEWEFPGQFRSMVFHYDVDLPQGARKRITFYALSESFARIGQLRLLEGNQELVKQQVPLEPIEMNEYTIGVLSSDTTLLNSLSAMDWQNRHMEGSRVFHLQPDYLPEDAPALNGLDALFLHDIATANLSDEQRAALKKWVSLGGQLVISGGIHASDTTAGLVDILPVTVGELLTDVSLAPLQEVLPARARDENNLPDNTTVSQVELAYDAHALDEQRLLTVRQMGDGQVFFTAFDLNALRAWRGEPQLWASVLREEMRFDPTISSGWSQSLLDNNTLELPALRLPPLWLFIVFLLSYILLVGPINFLVLRLIKRVELAWVTIPVIVLLFVAGTYGASFIVRGTRPEVTHLSVVQGFEQQERGMATAHIGIFSPRRQVFTLTFPGDVLVRIVNQGSGTQMAPIVWGEEETRIQDALVDVSSFRTFIAEKTVDMPLQVRSDLEIKRGVVQGEVENLSNEPFPEAMLVYGNSVQYLDTMQPGATAEIQLDRDLFNFPDAPRLSEDGVFNRRQMLFSLFEQNTFNVETIEDSAVYLLVWKDEQVIDMQIGTNANSEHHLTLYVIRLQT
jgi:hypothetical protein